jgi:DNA replication and repair protein RecF
MDWAVFHVEPQFGEQWARYTRALKQRNAALRTQPDHATAWDAELVRLGEQVAAARRQFMDRLQPYWRDTAEALSAVRPELHYSQGWSQESTLAAALSGSRARDITKHLTHVGPHRADVLVRLGTRAAREVLSRGQQKLVAVAMTLAQLRFLQDATGMRPTLLLDDPAAELDREHLERFIRTVTQLDGQLVITALDPASHPFGTPDRMFHVEQGHVS